MGSARRRSVLRLIIEDDEGHKTVVPFQRDEITIGRGEENVIRLPERNVSRRHCRLTHESGSTFVEDLGSYNGVRVNGERISGRKAIAPGDLLQIGDYDVALETDIRPESSPPLSGIDDTSPSLQLPDATAARPPAPRAAEPASPAPARPGATPSSVPAAAPASSPAAARPTPAPVNLVREVRPVPEADRPRLVILAGAQPGRELTIDRTVVSAGRAPECNLVIDDPSLARTHAQFVRDGDQWKVVEVSSLHAVKVNRQSCTEAPLRDGDVVWLGDVQMRWVAPGAVFLWVPPPPEAPAPSPRARSRLLIALVLLAAAAAALTLWALGRALAPAPAPAAAPAEQAAGAVPAGSTAGQAQGALGQGFHRVVLADAHKHLGACYAQLPAQHGRSPVTE